jgi:hypothetical protein
LDLILEKHDFSSPVQLLPKLTNTDKVCRQYGEQGSSLGIIDIIPLDMTPRTSLINYERTPRPPPTATTNGYYDDIHEKKKEISSTVRLVH